MSETEGSSFCCFPMRKKKSRKGRSRSESRNREVMIRNDPVTHEAADRLVGQQGTSPDQRVGPKPAGHSLGEQEPETHDQPATAKVTQRPVGQHATSTGEDPVKNVVAKRSLRDRLLDGAILFTKFTSVVGGASDLLGPLKAASDCLGFALQTVKARIGLRVTNNN
jgi:hypothetical protein